MAELLLSTVAVQTKKTVWRKPLWWIRLTEYEYWPLKVLYLPLLFVWAYHAIRLRKLAYFTAINPGFPAGSFYGTSKKGILDLIPDTCKPATILVYPDQPLAEQIFDWRFPLIAKPDKGQRGQGVEKIADQDGLERYHHVAGSPYIIQDYVDYPVEAAVLYSRLPGTQKGMITSLTLKNLLSVKGDGQHTIGELVHQNDRARFQEFVLYKKLGAESWQQIPAEGTTVLLEPIGNHCRGTQFVSAQHLINPTMELAFDQLADKIKGFQYGRYDLRVPSVEDLLSGKNIQIVELNGVNADPAHIYDGNWGLFRSWGDLIWHWHRIAVIAELNIRHGMTTLPPSKVWRRLINNV
jgi:hypothetical protein